MAILGNALPLVMHQLQWFSDRIPPVIDVNGKCQAVSTIAWTVAVTSLHVFSEKGSHIFHAIMDLEI